MTERDGAQRPAYHILTARLLIRCWEPTDAAALKAAIDASLDHLRAWMPWTHDEPEPVQAKVERLRQARGRFDRDEDYWYGIFDREELSVLGAAGLHTRLGEGIREIGYWIHAAHVRQGYATEAAAALTRVAFEVDGVQRVEIHHDPANEASRAVPQKLGFRQEATRIKFKQEPGGTWRDTVIWTLHRGEYPASPAALTPVEAFDVIGRRLL
jgi:RimJ/RimL family protein N-acetyltransferase